MPMARLRVGLAKVASLKSGDFARSVPEVKDLNNTAVLMRPVVDVQRGVQKPPHAGVAVHRSTHGGKTPQEINVIQERSSEPFRGPRMVRPRPGHDGLEVYNRRLRDSNFEIHSGIIFRTSSREKVRPSSASLIPRSIAAAVSASTSTSSSVEPNGSSGFTSAMP